MKSYDELTIQDNFIFQKIMRNKRICKQTLERLLDVDIKDISYPEEEKAIDVRLDSKSIRMDVYVNDDDGTVFNVEMQTSKNMEELAKRTRYYQAMIDIDLLEKGQDYDALNDTYIIFICTFDIFEGKRHKYTFRNLCEEDNGVKLNDGTTKMFLSTKGEKDDVSKALKNFLDYVDGHAPADELMKEIDTEVVTAKSCEEWRREYMTLELEIKKREKMAAIKILISLFKKSRITAEEAAKEAGITVAEFNKFVATLP